MTDKLAGFRPRVSEFKLVAAPLRRRVRTMGQQNPLHLLEDGNYSDADMQYIMERAIEKGEGEHAALAFLLLKMTKSQRARVAHWWLCG